MEEGSVTQAVDSDLSGKALGTFSHLNFYLFL